MEKLKPTIKRVECSPEQYVCKYSEDLYVEVLNASEQEFWNYLCVGVGKTPTEAYQDWLKDCDTWHEHKGPILDGE